MCVHFYGEADQQVGQFVSGSNNVLAVEKINVFNVL